MNSRLSHFQWYLVSLKRRFSSSQSVFVVTALSLFVISALAVPLILVSSAVSSQQTGNGVLTQIQVNTASAGGQNNAPITNAKITSMKQLQGVTAVNLDESIGLYAASDGSSGGWSTQLKSANASKLPPGVEQATLDSLKADEIIAPDTLDNFDFTKNVGELVAVSYTQMTGDHQGSLKDQKMRVVATYDPSWQGYGPGAVLGNDETVMRLLAAKSGVSADQLMNTVGINSVVVTADSEDSVPKVTEEIRKLGVSAVPVRDSLGTLPGIFSLFPTVIGVAAIAVVLLLSFQISSSIRSSVSRRAEEFGLLRTRGWKVSDVRNLLVFDSSIGTIAGTVVGCILGVVAGFILYATFGRQSGAATPETPWGLIILVEVGLIVLPALLATLISLWATARSLKRDPFLEVMMTPMK